jgi:gluconate 2-dehydrogenase gamma chain
MTEVHSRRQFLRAAAAAGAAWATADLVLVEQALAQAAHDAASGPQAFAALTAGQAATVDAVASRIIPAVDGRPGAHEAGAVYFIDRALAGFNAKQKRLYADGLKDLDRRAARDARKPIGFAALATDRQIALLRGIERTPFFQALRFDTIVGTFGSPAWGGNRDMAGWRLLGFDHRPEFQPPFGYYDTEANR